MPRSLTIYQRQVRALLNENPEISYDEIAARLLISRSTAIQAVKRLELEREFVRVPGRGKRANRYLDVRRVAIGRPSQPWPVVKV